MDVFGLVGGGGFAGADGPDGFVGDDDLRDLFGGEVVEAGVDLAGDDGGDLVGFALDEGLADAHDWDEVVVEGGLYFLVDGLVGFVEVLAAFGVADDDVIGSGVFDLEGGALAGVGAGVFWVGVLGGYGDVGVFEVGGDLG